MRIERIRLEDHSQSASRGRLARDVAFVDLDRAAAGFLQPGYQPQQGGLSAAGRTDEDHELAVFDLQIDTFDHLQVTEPFLDLFQRIAPMTGSP